MICETCSGTILAPSRIGAPRGTCRCQRRRPPPPAEPASPGVNHPDALDPSRSQPTRSDPPGAVSSQGAARPRQEDGIPANWTPLHTIPVRLDAVAALEVVLTTSGRVCRVLPGDVCRVVVLGSTSRCAHGLRYCMACHGAVVTLAPDTPVRVCSTRSYAAQPTTVFRPTVEDGPPILAAGLFPDETPVLWDGEWITLGTLSSYERHPAQQEEQ